MSASRIYADAVSAQTHLHCDEDWVWFPPSASATYQIRTFNLIGSADTVLQLYNSSDSSGLLVSDDNGGFGLASLIEWSNSSDTTYWVRITESGDSYGSSMGYDIEVTTCYAGCPCPDDDWEEDDTMGAATTVTVGAAAQPHLHCDEDWITFSTDVGATYRIETMDLTGSADTVLELYASYSLVASDDNSGTGLASLLQWTATHHWADVRIKEWNNDYQDGEGYSVQVTCIDSCPCSDDGYEDNDIWATATGIPLGSAQIHKHCDTDWFTFQAGAGATYRIETYNLTGGADTLIDLYEGSALEASDDNSGVGLGSLVTWTASSDGWPHVGVTEYAGDYQEGEGYTILVDCIENCPCADDSWEHDDTVLTAMDYTPYLGSSLFHYHCDVDWNKFTPSTGATYRIETFGLGGGADTVLHLFGSGSSLLAWDDDGGAGSASLITWTASTDPTLYVKVSEYAEDYRPGEYYSFLVECIADCPCTDDGFEPDDHISAATVIAVDGSSQAHYHCDEDWVTFNADYGATYRIQTYNLAGGADTVIDLYGSAGVIASDDNSGGGLASLLTWTATGTGWYEVQITEYADDYRPGERYSISVDCVDNCPCTDDGYEPDDHISAATTIYPNVYSAQTHYHCDEDWVEFDADLGATYRIETSNLQGGADTVLNLYGSGGLLATDDDGGENGASLITWTASSDLHYWVQISEYADDYQPLERYDIRVDCIADCPCTDDGYEENDAYGSDTYIPLGSAQIHKHCDVDWLEFTAVTGATYRVETYNLTGGADTVIDLYASTSLVATDDNSGTGLGSLLTWTATADGSHRVKVTEYADDYQPGEGYTILVDCTDNCPCTDDAFEDDDVYSQASTIYVDGATQTHSLCDADWVTFEPFTGATYRIQTWDLVGGADTVLDLFDSSGLITSDDNSGGGLASLLTWTAGSPNWHHVRVTEYAGDYEEGKGYKIGITCVADCPCYDDAYEDDDILADAVPLAIDAVQTHNLCDEDWMRFSVVGGAHYQVATSNLSTGTDTVLELWDSSSMITSDDNGGGGLASLLDWTASANGVVYVRLTVQGDAYEAGKQCDIQLQCDSGCRNIFTDGFESGNLSAWSSTFP
jgi:G:T-mismatch repair DNA endonuclease (very short patch repair protein)